MDTNVTVLVPTPKHNALWRLKPSAICKHRQRIFEMRQPFGRASKCMIKDLQSIVYYEQFNINRSKCSYCKHPSSIGFADRYDHHVNSPERSGPFCWACIVDFELIEVRTEKIRLEGDQIKYIISDEERKVEIVVDNADEIFKQEDEITLHLLGRGFKLGTQEFDDMYDNYRLDYDNRFMIETYLPEFYSPKPQEISKIIKRKHELRSGRFYDRDLITTVDYLEDSLKTYRSVIFVKDACTWFLKEEDFPYLQEYLIPFMTLDEILIHVTSKQMNYDEPFDFPKVERFVVPPETDPNHEEIKLKLYFHFHVVGLNWHGSSIKSFLQEKIKTLDNPELINWMFCHNSGHAIRLYKNILPECLTPETLSCILASEGIKEAAGIWKDALDNEHYDLDKLDYSLSLEIFSRLHKLDALKLQDELHMIEHLWNLESTPETEYLEYYRAYLKTIPISKFKQFFNVLDDKWNLISRFYGIQDCYTQLLFELAIDAFSDDDLIDEIMKVMMDNNSEEYDRLDPEIIEKNRTNYDQFIKKLTRTKHLTMFLPLCTDRSYVMNVYRRRPEIIRPTFDEYMIWDDIEVFSEDELFELNQLVISSKDQRSRMQYDFWIQLLDKDRNRKHLFKSNTKYTELTKYNSLSKEVLYNLHITENGVQTVIKLDNYNMKYFPLVEIVDNNWNDIRKKLETELQKRYIENKTNNSIAGNKDELPLMPSGYVAPDIKLSLELGQYPIIRHQVSELNIYENKAKWDEIQNQMLDSKEIMSNIISSYNKKWRNLYNNSMENEYTKKQLIRKYNERRQPQKLINITNSLESNPGYPLFIPYIGYIVLLAVFLGFTLGFKYHNFFIGLLGLIMVPIIGGVLFFGIPSIIDNKFQWNIRGDKLKGIERIDSITSTVKCSMKINLNNPNELKLYQKSGNEYYTVQKSGREYTYLKSKGKYYTHRVLSYKVNIDSSLISRYPSLECIQCKDTIYFELLNAKNNKWNIIDNLLKFVLYGTFPFILIHIWAPIIAIFYVGIPIFTSISLFFGYRVFKPVNIKISSFNGKYMNDHGLTDVFALTNSGERINFEPDFMSKMKEWTGLREWEIDQTP